MFYAIWVTNNESEGTWYTDPRNGEVLLFANKDLADANAQNFSNVFNINCEARLFNCHLNVNTFKWSKEELASYFKVPVETLADEIAFTCAENLRNAQFKLLCKGYTNPYQTFANFKIEDLTTMPIGETILLLVDGSDERVDIELVPVTYNGRVFSSTLNQGRVHEKLILAWGKPLKQSPQQYVRLEDLSESEKASCKPGLGTMYVK
jgi:hypothetical protein